MLHVDWPRVKGDLASTRRSAAVFLNDLSFKTTSGSSDAQDWLARWTTLGDTHCLLAQLNVKKLAFAEATEAWLGALTAFEVARRLADEDDLRKRDISAKVEATIGGFGSSLKHKIEPVQIGPDADPVAYYWAAGGPVSCRPAVICISKEEETAPTLLGRLLPAVFGRCISILVVSHRDVAHTLRGQSEMLLSYCADYLSARPDVDATRIGVYGEGLSAILATDFAVSDCRIAAAVCDGGLWNWTRLPASVGWISKCADEVANPVSARRSGSVERLKSPVLVVAGGRGLVSMSEAKKLQAECAGGAVDLEIVTSQMTHTPVGEIENFVTSDDHIFEWLERKLAHSSAHAAA